VWLLAIRVLGVDGREREGEKKGESKPAPKESRPIFHYECFHCSSLPRLVHEPKPRQKRQASMAQQARVCPLPHFGETIRD
jgi:hypothetical protein